MVRVVLFVLLNCCCSLYHVSAILVDTEYGQVRGHPVDVNNGREAKTVNVFYGIPFANDTSGPRRFMNPVPPEPWSNIFEADTLREACPQRRGGLMIMTHPFWDSYGEDCLHLNIFTPSEAGSYPVMLWFHGGGFRSGANIQYPGHFMASRDVVVVVANYRLGNFGFSYTANSACPGNAGLWDNKMALEFVVTNIANFGGDPQKITVFGQSAGAVTTALLMVSPETKDLFQQAIMESGTEASFFSVNWPEQDPENYTRQVAEELNCIGTDDFNTMNCLREQPWESISNISIDCSPGHFCLGMAPVVDGDGGFLPKLPQELREDGDIMKGPIISGFTKDDGSFYTLNLIPESLFGGFNRTEFLTSLRDSLIEIWRDSLDNVTAEDIFHATDWNYAPWPYTNDEYQNREAFNKMITDGAFGEPWDRQLKKHYLLAPTYGYVYNYRGRNVTQVFPEWMGVPHMGEIPHVWGYPLLQLNDAVRNDSGILLDIINWTEEDIRHTIYWQDLYENFAKYGNPTPDPVTDPLGGSSSWPRFSEDDMAVLYVSNTTITIAKDYEQKDYAFWRNYMEYILRNKESSTRDSVSQTGIPSNQFTDVINEYFDMILERRLSVYD